MSFKEKAVSWRQEVHIGQDKTTSDQGGNIVALLWHSDWHGLVLQ